MNIADLLNQITEAILHFDLKKFLDNLKPLVIIAAVIGLVLILIGAFFSLIPQF